MAVPTLPHEALPLMVQSGRPVPVEADLEAVIVGLSPEQRLDTAFKVFELPNVLIFHDAVGPLLWAHLTAEQRASVVYQGERIPKQAAHDALFAEAIAQLPVKDRADTAGWVFRHVAEYGPREGRGRMEATQHWLTLAQQWVAELPPAAQPDAQQALLDRMGEAAHQAFANNRPDVAEWLVGQPGMAPVVLDCIKFLIDDECGASDMAMVDKLATALPVAHLQAIEQRLQEEVPEALTHMPLLCAKLHAHRRQTQAHEAAPSVAKRRLRRS